MNAGMAGINGIKTIYMDDLIITREKLERHSGALVRER
jgi:hypothetical protein